MKRKWLLRIGLMLLAPLVLLLGVELVWQLLGDPRVAEFDEFLENRPPHFALSRLGMLRADPDPEISFGLSPGFDKTVAGDRYRVNEHGMRGGTTPVAKPGGARRVLVLGDSYAFGFGVGEDATIASQLGDALAKDHSGIEVLNAGVPGYHTGQEAAALLRDGFRFAPDLVVLVYYPNDNMTPVFHYDPRIHNLYVDELPLPRSWKQVLARSIVYSRITKGYTAWLTWRGELDARGDRHWASTRARLVRLAKACEDRKAGFVVAAIPALVDSTKFVDRSHPDNRDHDRLLDFCKDLGIPVADLRAPLLERNRYIEELFVSQQPLDNHLNADGYAILVHALVATIRDAKLLK